MRYEITKSFRFEAAHSLPHLPECHQCHRLHGHSYELIVGVSGPVSNHWVQDYADIAAVVCPLVAQLDHRNLDEIFHPVATTAENVATWFWRKLAITLPMLSRIEIRETPTSNVILTHSRDECPDCGSRDVKGGESYSECFVCVNCGAKWPLEI